MDQNVLIGILALAMAASMLCGVFPAWRSSKVPAAEVLKDEAASISGGSRNRRLLSGLVVMQIALSLALLVCSGLFLQTLRNLASANPGFEQDHVLTVSVGLNMAGYSNEDALVIRHKIIDRVSALPGVSVAALTDWVPMSFTRKTADAYPEGYAPKPHESLEVRRADVGPRYFETLGIQLVGGRDFTQADDAKAPKVLIVDQTAANRYWPGRDPIGKKLSLQNHQLFTVVGVVKNTKHQFLSEQTDPMIYMSYFQDADNETTVQIKTRGNPAEMASAVEEAIREVDGGIPVFDVRTLRETTQMARIFAVMQSTFAGMFAVIALILAATGIYGVVAYRTQLRTHEIGVRVALGASRADVLKLVLLQGLWLTAIGLTLGLALAFALTRFIDNLLYGVSAYDAETVIGVVAMLGGMSLLACYLPAHRAMKADPVAAIRAQ
jgi:predicted permease